MKYRDLGNTDLKVSEIGFGCQSIGGGLYYKNDLESIRTLNYAYDSGINFFDTSDHYSLGESEKLIGRTFKGKRDKIIIGTKTGTLYSQTALFLLKARAFARPVGKYLKSLKIYLHSMRAKEKRKDFSPGHLIEAVENSLKHLQTDYIDIYQLHKPSKEILKEGKFIGTLELLKKQGKIRYFGISCQDNEDAFLCLKHPEISSVQLTFNLLDNKFIKDILPAAKEKKMGIIARNPRAQGHLTAEFSDIMAETYAKDYREFESKKEKAKQFEFLITKNRTLAQAALQFVLNSEEVSTAIPRAVNTNQLKEILGTFDAPPLQDSEISKISSIKNSLNK
ncbi:MAG: aldo/keto reductase [Ignavibacteriaceae bacterium]